MTAASRTAVFCISLRDSQRRPAFLELARAHAVEFEFVDAVSPADLQHGFTIKDCRVDLTDLRWTRDEQIDLRRQFAPLSYGEISCAYSHILCWQIGQARDLDSICIFEDDAIICQRLNSIGIPDGVDLLYLNERVPRNRHGEITDDGGGTYGYVLSRTGIRKCLEIFRVLHMPIDLQLMAHEMRASGGRARRLHFRRDMDGTCYLNARASIEPYCRHPDDAQSQIFPFVSQQVAVERDGLRVERDGLRVERDGLHVERDALRLDYDALRLDYDALRLEYDALRLEREALRLHRDALRLDGDALRLDRNALRLERDALRPERDRLHQELAALRCSTSWRFTAPARAVIEAVRRVARPAVRG